MIAIIVLSLMILSGCVLMYASIFSEDKDIEPISIYGAADLFAIVVSLFLSFSTIKIKRIFIFILGLFLAGFFLYILIFGSVV
ncbi:hypothetical protein [Planococcus sp. YIM B11945]|uniref:hypothetical protein n=1 Tax=Planococcus sp. YIM B11945 TaxID=3435410 RepID=UPI003D7CF575